MRVKLYTLERNPWHLESFRNDERELPDMPPGDAAPLLVKYSSKSVPFVAYTCDTDPEYLYTLPTSYASDSKRTRALRLWAEGSVFEREDLRIMED